MSAIGKKKKFKIKGFKDKEIARKLISMGVLPGTEIEIVRKSPFFGKAMYIKAGDQIIAMRDEEFREILLM